MWRSPFDLSTELTKPKINLLEEVNRVYEQIQPFYKQVSFPLFTFLIESC